VAFDAEDEESAEAEAEPEQAATPNWDDDSNPYKAQVQAVEAEKQRAAQIIARAEQMRQQNERNVRIQTQMESLPNLDPDALKGTVAQLIVDAATPLLQQKQDAESYAEGLAKFVTIRELQAEFGLGAGDVQILQGMNDPYAMRGYAQNVKQTSVTKDNELAETRKQLAILQKQLKARQRDPNADLVGGSNGVPPSSRKAPSELKTMDDYWETYGAQITGRPQ
jgi:hypothetical protein